jgi:hypothetical protein
MLQRHTLNDVPVNDRIMMAMSFRGLNSANDEGTDEWEGESLNKTQVLNESVGCVLSDERECKQDNND